MTNESPVGTEYARTRDIVAASAVLLLLTAVLVTVLVQAWPPAPGTGPDGRVQPPAAAVAVHLPGWSPRLTREASLFTIVLAAGALGSVVHALRSLYWYVGNRSLRRSWLMMYLFLPFVGALLGLIVYLVLRGGLTSPAGGSSDINPYGITAIAALVGLFSRETAEKLRTVFATLLAPAQPGRDQALAARITAVDPSSGAPGTAVTVHGTGLGSATGVRFGGAEAPVTDVTDTRLRTTVPPGAVSGHPVVTTPGGPATGPAPFTVG
ncbi:IPT/TIG domain-containing protein [Actinomadura roseirufa]|uniref:IPT/TIG domain-containing protein n=1 Tax=Actinomadura roseirufa TaxID=2094049 RepID=UPI0013F1616D|nr:IPT/TIG domain-containing protein [Actinomadura roseirufa]